jgi:hypothetical protein
LGREWRLAQQRRRQAEAAERGPLFRRMAAEAIGDLALNDLTVLAVANDPYRLDTSANRRDGQWLADQITTPRNTAARSQSPQGLSYRRGSWPLCLPPYAGAARNLLKARRGFSAWPHPFDLAFSFQM